MGCKHSPDASRGLPVRVGCYFELYPAAGGTAQPGHGQYSTQRWKGGFSYRRGGKLSVTGDIEAAGTNAAYFSTSLYRYQRGRLQGSYQADSQLTFSGSFSAIGNQNPAPKTDYEYFGMQSSLSVLWNPAAKKRIGLQGTYTRATLRSDITFLVPQTLQPEQSRYRDNSHSIRGTMTTLRLQSSAGRRNSRREAPCTSRQVAALPTISNRSAD